MAWMLLPSGAAALDRARVRADPHAEQRDQEGNSKQEGQSIMTVENCMVEVLLDHGSFKGVCCPLRYVWGQVAAVLDSGTSCICLPVRAPMPADARAMVPQQRMRIRLRSCHGVSEPEARY
eukprot:1767392-Rhodomonas_salina.2